MAEKKTTISGRKAETTVKAEKKTAAKAKAAEWIIQSPFGREITLEEIQKRIGMPVDKVYIRADHKKAYWVQGKNAGDVDLW